MMASSTPIAEKNNIGMNGSSLGYNPVMPASMSYGPVPFRISNRGPSSASKDDLAQAFSQMSTHFTGTIVGNGSNHVMPFHSLGAAPGTVGSFYQLPDGRIIPFRFGGPARYLGPRRDSSSSNEENGPHTPIFHPYCQPIGQTKFSHTELPPALHTPSPPQMNVTASPYQMAKTPNGQYFFTDLSAVCLQEPTIPRPIPAIFSGEGGRGTLERSLQNSLNTTNVYIRGLHPNTTDDMLHSYGARFGKIVSAKSMLERESGNCKGFGFIRYHNFTDGENCIRAFFHWGYEAKWARASHNEKLKTLGDENNTNLYVSNLPKDFNEYSLMACFGGLKVLSAKILRDNNGMSRGVGFARLATPDICRKVIEQCDGMKVGDEGNVLSVRFADTPEQKHLKEVTAERRQYKAAEYNTAAYSPGSPYAPGGVPVTYNSPLQFQAPATAWNPHTQLPDIIVPSPFPAHQQPPIPDTASASKSWLPKETDEAENSSSGSPEVEPASSAGDGLNSRSGNVQSPSKSEGGSKTDCCILETKIEAKSSPIKASKYSPVKSSPAKVNLIRT